MLILKKYLDNYCNIPALSLSLLAITFIESIGSGLSFYISLYFKAYLNLPVSVIGFIISCFGLGTITGGWLGGKLADKITPLTTNIISLFGFATTFILLVFFHQPFALCLIMFFKGCASCSFITANGVLVLRTAKENEEIRLKLINLKRVINNVGIIIASILFTTYSHANLYIIFITMGCCLYGAACYQFNMRRNKEYQLLNNPVLQENKELLPVKANLKKLFYVTLLCVFAVGLIASQRKVAYPIFVKASFDSAAVISFILALNPFLVIFLQPTIVNFFGQFNKIMMMGLGALGLSAGMLILYFSPALPIFIFSVVVYAVGEMIFFSLSQLLCYQSQAEHHKGKALGLWRVALASSNVIGPYLGGMLYEQAAPALVWLFCGFLGIICFALTIFLLNDPQLKAIYR